MTGAKAVKMLGQIYKGYIYKNLVRDVAKFARKEFNDIDFDKKALLKRVGLKPYSPAKSTFGAFSWILLGGAVGVVAGVLLAPKAGSEIFEDLKTKATDFVQEKDLASTSAPAQA